MILVGEGETASRPYGWNARCAVITVTGVLPLAVLHVLGFHLVLDD
jgi:hypothetical protein